MSTAKSVAVVMVASTERPVEVAGWVQRAGQAWYRGWLGFVAASGGEATDLVGANPWHVERARGGKHAQK